MYIIEGDVICECDLMTKGVEGWIVNSRGHANKGVRASDLIVERSKTNSNVVCHTSDPVRCQEQ